MLEVDSNQELRDEFANFITRLMDDPYEYEPNDPWVQGMASACVAICRKGQQPNQNPGPLARLASPELIESLLAENSALRAELQDQWESNHAEHCDNMDTYHRNGGRCTWPYPEILKAARQ